jgi:peptidyl-prolyl cis-trans isomerase A (cyclophilin A)
MSLENPHICLQTDIGKIVVELYAQQAPLPVENFLRYVDERRFADASFYRVVRMDNQPQNEIKIEIIQGGLNGDDHPQSLPAIGHETTLQTGVLHTEQTISMARNEPRSASSEFFICIGDQPELDFGGRRNANGQGFAAFGKVTQGMDIVRSIQNRPCSDQALIAEVKILFAERIG